MDAPSTNPFDQHSYQVRLEWGAEGVALFTPACAVLVVVDVLSFSTAVSVAVSRGASVLPLPWQGTRAAAAAHAAAAARAAGAVLAAGRGAAGWSLSPASLMDLPAGTRLALPSPNGARLSAAADAGSAVVLAGCLRNASAVAATAARLAGSGAIGVVPAGERWRLDGAPLRPAVEDLLGAGAVIAGLLQAGAGPPAPEALAAVDAFGAARRRGLAEVLAGCSSGRELAADGYQADVTLAAEYDVSDAVPVLRDGEFRA